MTCWRVLEKDGRFKAQIAYWGFWHSLSAMGYGADLWANQKLAEEAAIAAAQAHDRKRRNRWLIWRTVKSGAAQ